MSIRFETTVDQLVAFNRFHCENSPTLRRQRLALSAIAPVLVLIVGYTLRPLLPLDANTGLLFGVFVFMGAAVSFFLTRWRMLPNIERSCRKMLAEGSNRTVLGRCEVSLVDDRLFVKRELMESRYDLRAIQKIVTTDDFTFVYLAAVSALVIPMRIFPEDEYSDFVIELREAWENREARRPIEKPDDRIQLTKTT